MSEEKLKVYKIKGKNIYKWPFGFKQQSSYIFVAEDGSFVAGRVKLGAQSKWLLVKRDEFDPSDIDVVGSDGDYLDGFYLCDTGGATLYKAYSWTAIDDSTLVPSTLPLLAGTEKLKYKEKNFLHTVGYLNQDTGSYSGQYLCSRHYRGDPGDTVREASKFCADDIAHDIKVSKTEANTANSSKQAFGVLFASLPSYALLFPVTKRIVTTKAKIDGSYALIELSSIPCKRSQNKLGVYFSSSKFGVYTNRYCVNVGSTSAVHSDSFSFDSSGFDIVLGDTKKLKTVSFVGISQKTDLFKRLCKAYRAVQRLIASCPYGMKRSYSSAIFLPAYTCPYFYATKDSVECLISTLFTYLYKIYSYPNYYIDTAAINDSEVEDYISRSWPYPAVSIDSVVEKLSEQEIYPGTDIGFDCTTWPKYLSGIITAVNMLRSYSSYPSGTSLQISDCGLALVSHNGYLPKTIVRTMLKSAGIDLGYNTPSTVNPGEGRYTLLTSVTASKRKVSLMYLPRVSHDWISATAIGKPPVSISAYARQSTWTGNIQVGSCTVPLLSRYQDPPLVVPGAKLVLYTSSSMYDTRFSHTKRQKLSTGQHTIPIDQQGIVHYDRSLLNIDYTSLTSKLISGAGEYEFGVNIVYNTSDVIVQLDLITE